MAAYHVFVEGPVDSSPGSVERLAAAIAEHYGLPVAELQARLARGRFRVKGNCDRETAELYVRDLGRLGARCAIEDAATARTSSPSLPPATAPARTSSPSLPPATAPARTSSPSLPPRTTTLASSPALPRTLTPSPLPPRTTTPSTPPANYQSGLAAAFSGEMPVASLGALDDAAATFTLSSVDGDEAAPKPAASFAPPPAAVTPGAPAPKPAAAEKPVDAFAPPDAGADFAVVLADEEVERAVAKKKAGGPAADAPPAPAPAPVVAAPVLAAPAPDPRRVQFALAVLVAVVIGFIPAHLLASAREREIDGEVETHQREADTQDAYDALDAFRAAQLARKHDERKSAMVLAFVVWAIAAGGIAFWFRRRSDDDAV